MKRGGGDSLPVETGVEEMINSRKKGSGSEEFFYSRNFEKWMIYY